MSHITIEQRRAFIRDLVIADSPREMLPAGEAEDDGAAVDAGSVLSFVRNVSLQHRQDTLNSTLLAQLGANSAHDRYEDPVNWYKKYSEVLENVGWVIQEFAFDKFKTSNASFTVDTVLIDMLAAILSKDEDKVIKEAINALKALANGEKAATIFSDGSTGLTKANAQLGAASDEHGILVMKMGFFYVNTTQKITRVLWFEFKSGESDMFKASSVVNLNDQIYAGLRQQVIDKLGDRAAKYIDDLPLGD